MKSMGISIAGSIWGARRMALYTALVAAAAGLFTSEAEDAAPKTKDQPSTNVVAKVKFVRPSTGAPSVRLTGGSRGIGDSSITLDVLAPDDVGLTTQEQPSLFWYQSKPAKAKF